MNNISIIVGYYRNKGMLEYQLELWKSYSEDVKNHFEIVVVDDGSPDMPALDILQGKREGLNIKLYRIKQDKPWNQVMARNLGAVVSSFRWIMFLDIDHIIPQELADYMLSMQLTRSFYYTFGRMAVRPEGISIRKPSHCLFVIHREDHWAIGGYDEDFCGNYGYSDAYWKHRAKGKLVEILNENIFLHCYLWDVVPQANDMSRERNKRPNRPLYNAKINGKLKLNRNYLRLPWERQL